MPPPTRFWVVQILIEPLSGGYPTIAPGFREMGEDTTEDIERRHVNQAIEDMRATRPDLIKHLERWKMDRDSETAKEALQWLQDRVDQMHS